MWLKGINCPFFDCNLLLSGKRKQPTVFPYYVIIRWLLYFCYGPSRKTKARKNPLFPRLTFLLLVKLTIYEILAFIRPPVWRFQFQAIQISLLFNSKISPCYPAQKNATPFWAPCNSMGVPCNSIERAVQEFRISICFARFSGWAMRVGSRGVDISFVQKRWKWTL